MGLSSPDQPSWSSGPVLPPVDAPYRTPPLPPWRREPVTRYVVLFLLTLVSTTLAGTQVGLGLMIALLSGQIDLATALPILGYGLWYSLSLLAILGAHEFGHYFACVYYRVNASLPYFLPMPLLFTGTLGAVIRIRQPMPNKRALFDIGIAGPIAGFVVAVPLVFIGMSVSTVVAIGGSEGGELWFGEPLLLKLAALLTFGPLPEGQTVGMHPILSAAWFGLLATCLNLFPAGQLDGGHIAYAVFGRVSTWITLATIVALVGLSFLSMSWIVWTILMVVMLFVLGPHHPRLYDEDVPLDRRRLWLAGLAAAIFAVCFTPAPIELMDLVGK
jgi:membrane-associated protease RseP (regulator of RpoE activity)